MGDVVSMRAAIQLLIAQLAIFQALLLALSAVHKSVRWARSKSVVQQFAGVPRPLATAALSAVIMGELVAGVSLIVPAYRPMGALLAALLWTVYLALIFRAILQGRRDVDCGCSFGSTARPLGSFHVARNAVLAGLAMMIAGVSAMSGSVPAQSSQVLGAIAYLALYGALDQVMALRPLRSGEIS
jgi:hypothetical protein